MASADEHQGRRDKHGEADSVTFRFWSRHGGWVILAWAIVGLALGLLG